MNNLRKYGQPPYHVAVVHGGPGAGGEMAPVARRLAGEMGILEPIQTEITLGGQIEELKTVLEQNSDDPAVLIGYSWGAWLSFLTAAKHPTLVKKLILVASGPFEAHYAEKIMPTRLSRLTEQEQAEAKSLLTELEQSAGQPDDKTLARFGALLSQADTFELTSDDSEPADTVACRAEIYQNVWPEAAELRRTGKLLQYAQRIRCPVVAIHGDYDPHPAEGVEIPLSKILNDFRFIVLKNCGHKPWVERQAKEAFYQVLKTELR